MAIELVMYIMVEILKDLLSTTSKSNHFSFSIELLMGLSMCIGMATFFGLILGVTESTEPS